MRTEEATRAARTPAAARLAVRLAFGALGAGTFALLAALLASPSAGAATMHPVGVVASTGLAAGIGALAGALLTAAAFVAGLLVRRSRRTRVSSTPHFSERRRRGDEGWGPEGGIW